MDAQIVANRQNPTLPTLLSPQPLRIAIFFSNKEALARYKDITTMPQMLAATEAIFAKYNLVLDVQPPLAKGLEDLVLGRPGRVRAPRKQTGEEYMNYLIDAKALGELADEKLKALKEQRVRLRVVICEYDYTEVELREAEKGVPRKKKLKLTKGEMLGTPTWKDPSFLPRVLINLNMVPSFLDYRLVLAHEIVHAADVKHPKAMRVNNLMNEGANSGYWLTFPQLKALAAAPFCAP